MSFLTRRFTYHSREEWEDIVRNKGILLNGDVVRPDQTLSTGDRIDYFPPDVPEPPVPRTVRILYRDRDLLAVDKPAGLPVHPAGRYFRHTLWAFLGQEVPAMPCHFVHRLDRETSGVVLIARSPEACAICARQIADGKAEKEYDVLVEGTFPASLEAEGILIPDSASRIRKKRAFVADRKEAGSNQPRGHRAVTHFRLLRTDGRLSWVRAYPRTGRTHQIRATLCSLGFPVVGDKLYGIDENLFLRFAGPGLHDADIAALRLPRQALHARRLVITHPRFGSKVALISPVPFCFLKLLYPGEGL